jgi:hypothetical protein
MPLIRSGGWGAFSLAATRRWLWISQSFTFLHLGARIVVTEIPRGIFPTERQDNDNNNEKNLNGICLHKNLRNLQTRSNHHNSLGVRRSFSQLFWMPLGKHNQGRCIMERYFAICDKCGLAVLNRQENHVRYGECADEQARLAAVAK